jgi:hypothetical protein
MHTLLRVIVALILMTAGYFFVWLLIAEIGAYRMRRRYGSPGQHEEAEGFSYHDN